MFIYSSIQIPKSETNDSQQNSLLKTIFNACPLSNHNKIPLCQFIIDYSSWFQTSQNHFIIPFEKILEALIKAIEDDTARSYGIEGLLKMCDNYGKRMKDYICLVLNIYESFINQSDMRSIHYQTENIKIKESDILMVMFIIV